MAKPVILVAEDDETIRLVISQTLSADGYAVRATASPEALQRWIRNGEGDGVVTDVYLGEDCIFDMMPAMRLERPELPFIIMSGQNTILTAASAAEHGAFDYLPKPFDIGELSSLVARALKQPSDSKRKIDRETREAERAAGLPLIGRSEVMQEVYRIISRVMNTDLSVLIEGEVGTGKELAARAIHDLGQDNQSSFILLDLENLNDQALNEALGSVRGGKRATLYIDEVASLSASQQAQLLSLMGELKTGRFITSTQYDLNQNVSEGRFRSDLFYRLNTVRLNLPPLRDRKEDIVELAKAFLIRARDQSLPAKQLDQGALDALISYNWPGNVRELENTVLHLCVLSPDSLISADDVKRTVGRGARQTNSDEAGLQEEMERLLGRYTMPRLMAADPNVNNRIYQDIIEQVEKPLISLALSVTSGNKVKAAALLGLNRNTLRAKMKALKLADE